MTKQFELKIPSEILEEFKEQCWYPDTGFVNPEKFGNLCATWGANQEYQESYEFVEDVWGSAHAEGYQRYRRPVILSKKEKAIEAIEYINTFAVSNMTGYTCHDKLKESMKILDELISSIPDEDT